MTRIAGETEREGAEGIVREGLAALRWSEAELSGQPKAHAQRVKLAQVLRRQTPVTRQRIATRLAMSSANYLSYLLPKS
jgi:hypothetical protein